MLISLLLSMLLITAVLQWYAVSKTSWHTIQATQKQIHAARVALQFIAQDIQASGYLGCHTQNIFLPLYHAVVQNHVLYRHHLLRRDRAVFGINTETAECLKHFPARLCERVKEKSDILLIYNVAHHVTPLKQPMQNALQPIQTNAANAVQKGALVLISDCRQGDFFIANDVSGQYLYHQISMGGNHTSTLSKAYEAKAEVSELQIIAYYIGKSAREKSTLSPRYVLYREDLVQGGEEIAENLTEFQVEYGIHSPAGVAYKAAFEVAPNEWSLVCAIRLKVKTNASNNNQWEVALALPNRPGSNNRYAVFDAHH